MSKIKRHKVGKALERAEKPKSKISKQAIWTIILGGLMIFSIFGIMFSSFNDGTDNMRYGDYKFKRTTAGWTTDIKDKTVEFTYLPQDLDNLNLTDDVKNALNNLKVTYITFNPNTKNVQLFELLRFELGMKMTELLNVYASMGVSEENPQYKQPLVDCRNATSSVPVINLVESNQTSVSVKDNCIIVEADKYGVPAVKDRILYTMLGILK